MRWQRKSVWCDHHCVKSVSVWVLCFVVVLNAFLGSFLFPPLFLVSLQCSMRVNKKTILKEEREERLCFCFELKTFYRPTRSFPVYVASLLCHSRYTHSLSLSCSSLDKKDTTSLNRSICLLFLRPVKGLRWASRPMMISVSSPPPLQSITRTTDSSMRSLLVIERPFPTDSFYPLHFVSFLLSCFPIDLRFLFRFSWQWSSSVLLESFLCISPSL